MSSSISRFVYQSGPSNFSIDDLVYLNRQGRRLIRGDCGIVIELGDGREQDEHHVKVRFLDLENEAWYEDWKDTKRLY